MHSLISNCNNCRWTHLIETSIIPPCVSYVFTEEENWWICPWGELSSSTVIILEKQCIAFLLQWYDMLNNIVHEAHGLVQRYLWGKNKSQLLMALFSMIPVDMLVCGERIRIVSCFIFCARHTHTQSWRQITEECLSIATSGYDVHDGILWRNGNRVTDTWVYSSAESQTFTLVHVHTSRVIFALVWAVLSITAALKMRQCLPLSIHVVTYNLVCKCSNVQISHSYQDRGNTDALSTSIRRSSSKWL